MATTTTLRRLPVALALAAGSFGLAQAAEPQSLIQHSLKAMPKTAPGAGDEIGMANLLGNGTNMRCSWHLSQPRSRTFELSHVRSNTMPKSPFSGPYTHRYKPTSSLPGSVHAFNGEEYEAGAEPSQQGTQIDALGHFAHLPQPWDGKPPAPVEQSRYYGGHSQQDVKPTADSPLLKLGVERIPPLITSAVLLDAKTVVGGGSAMKAGQMVTARDIDAMLRRQGLAARGILPGDMVFVYTGWGDAWKDPDNEKTYYAAGPGLAFDAARYLSGKRIVAIGVDVPFIDPVPEGMLQGKAAPAAGTPPNTPFAIHHHMLTQAGIYHIENANLGEAASQQVWTGCAIVLPLRTKGAAGSPVRPVLVGVPGQQRRGPTASQAASH
jgi:kynurenine formamidase